MLAVPVTETERLLLVVKIAVPALTLPTSRALHISLPPCLVERERAVLRWGRASVQPLKKYCLLSMLKMLRLTASPELP